jgi:hypothetical protein
VTSSFNAGRCERCRPASKGRLQARQQRLGKAVLPWWPAWMPVYA